MKGRKRQLAVDTLGLPLRVVVQAANVQDRLGGECVLRRVAWTPRWQRVRVDRGYDSPALAHWCQTVLGCVLDVTPASPQKGFVVQAGRWVVERTWAWFGRYRRLSKDYEQNCLMSEGFLYAASVHLLVRRLSR